MDNEKFTNLTGQLVQIDRPAHPDRRDWAFIPDELPPKWELPHHLWPLVAEARECLGTLNGIGQTLSDPELLLTPLQRQEALASTKIEGTFVTPEQIMLFELDPREARSTTDKAADWSEVMNYGDSLRVGRGMLEQSHITRHVIRSLHSVLMKGVRGRDKSPGQFRTRNVQIGSTARYIPPPHQEVDRLLENLELHIATTTDAIDPLVKCFVVHYQFEAIHPFEDGNGRVGRAMLALMIYKLLGHARPWLYMSAFYDRFQEEYFSNMFSISTVGAWDQWIEYCLNGTIAQAKDSILRCNKFNALKTAFHERMIGKSPTPRSHGLIDSLFRNPIIRVSTVQRMFTVHYGTAKADIDKLIEVKILSPLSGLRPKAFYSSEILAIAYD